MTPSPNSPRRHRPRLRGSCGRTTFIVTSHVRPDGDAIGSSVAHGARAAGARQVGPRRHARPPAGPVSRLPARRRHHLRRGGARRRRDRDRDGVRRPRADGPGRPRPAIPSSTSITIRATPDSATVQWFDGTAAACAEMVFDRHPRLGVPADRRPWPYTSTSPSSRTPGRSGIPACRRAPSRSARTCCGPGPIPSSIARQLCTMAAASAGCGCRRPSSTRWTSIDGGSIALAVGGSRDDRGRGCDAGRHRRPHQYPADRAGTSNAVAFFKRGRARRSTASACVRRATMDVGRIARDFGGGGHRNASGCTLDRIARRRPRRGSSTCWSAEVRRHGVGRLPVA